MQEQRVITTNFLLYGEPEETELVEETYCINHELVSHYTDYREAVLDSFTRRREGESVYVITVGRDPRDLILLRQDRTQRDLVESPYRNRSEIIRPSDLTEELIKLYNRSGDIRTEEAPAEITWELLVSREPRLMAVRAIAESVSNSGPHRYNSIDVWYGGADIPVYGLRDQMIRLVGHGALSDDPVLRSERGYDVAYRTLYDCLPCDIEDDEFPN